jgi:AraC family transcriptional regulator of adaptative response / DNA-3-methyladenine glycosylase II
MNGLRDRTQPEPVRTDETEVERVTRVAAAVRRTPSDFASAADVARAAGVGVARLNATVRDHFHTTPRLYLARARVDAAARVLARPRARLGDAADAGGFDSASAFDDAFREQLGMSAAAYRALATTTRFTIRLPVDYRAEFTLRTIGRDAESPSERVDGRRFVKLLPGERSPLRLDVALHRGRARCEVRAARGRVGGDDMRRAHAVALRLLGLHLDPAPFEQRIARVRKLQPLVNGRAGLRIPLTADRFEAVAWAIVGQQINLAFAYRLRRVLIALAGQDAGDGLRAHPTPGAIAGLDYADLTTRQFSRRKAEYVIDTARAIMSGSLPLDALADGPVPLAEATILATRGFGPWTTQYVLMRGFGCADCVPVGDSGLATALGRFFAREPRPDARETRALMQPFAPYRSLATFHLWMSLGATP